MSPIPKIVRKRRESAFRLSTGGLLCSTQSEPSSSKASATSRKDLSQWSGSFGLCKRSTTLRKTEETLRQANETIGRKEEQNKEKDKQLQMKDETIAQQATTIAELTKKLGEFVAMEKRLNDKLSTTHSKVVAVEAQMTEAAKDVKWIRDMVPPDHAITIWDPTHFRKEGRRITSLVEDKKSCFSDEITRGVWKLSIRCDRCDWHKFGVIDSSHLEQSKTGGVVWQTGKHTATGNQKPNNYSVVTMELDMNRHTLVLFVDGQRQPHSLTNIPQNSHGQWSSSGSTTAFCSPNIGQKVGLTDRLRLLLFVLTPFPLTQIMMKCKR
ncbi:hypothetical protein BLNAU_21254 [Blattamonas nauphoetae]|uniref:Uncharacterized protein n=1 Tax=Blattamonas nauphoetae TaxID=2049346 RepID=A0ABQ9WWD9_9EUKA|nr:hypothetical protein BLNAU_21254 [Blattamonas nauphoetae]